MSFVAEDLPGFMQHLSNQKKLQAVIRLEGFYEVIEHLIVLLVALGGQKNRRAQNGFPHNESGRCWFLSVTFVHGFDVLQTSRRTADDI